LGDVTVALRARRSLLRVSQILSALPAPPLATTHRQGHKQHYEHDCDGNNDDNDSRRYRCHGDQQGVTHFGSSKSFLSEGYPDAAAANGSKQTGSLLSDSAVAI
jgi:hypothetical protein